MLFTVFGVNTALAVQMATSEITYLQTETTHLAQGADASFAARAPPMAVDNVEVTGGVTVVQGSAFTLHGQETVASLFGFNADHIATNKVFTKDNAFDTIDQFRTKKGGLDELGDSIPIKGDGNGTVAFVEVNGKPIFGVNSSTLVRDADKNLGRSWIDRLGLSKGKDQIVWHGEGHSLMRAYEKTGGKLPENMTMFVDRVSCANCRTHLPKRTEEMGVKNLTLNFKNGRSGKISDGKFEWLD
jgi:hypothetical protein